MYLRLKDLRDVRAFSVSVTAVVILGTLTLGHVMLPPQVAAQIWFTDAFIALSLAAPLTYFVGLKFHDIHRLTLDLELSAQVDCLTGAMRRSAYHQHVAALPSQPMTVIVADIDKFKSFNDRFGHLAGDAALRHVATVLRKDCRKDDLVARFGGEEFVILLTGTGLAAGARVAERLCSRLRKQPVMIERRAVTVTASFGVAHMDTPDAFEETLARADASLYEAKHAGRNRVCLAD